jgi:predicted component of type VI protein secretion system
MAEGIETMSTTQLANLIGKRIMLYDARTGAEYEAQVQDAKEQWGKLRIAVNGIAWFEPTRQELDSVAQLND